MAQGIRLRPIDRSPERRLRSSPAIPILLTLACAACDGDQPTASPEQPPDQRTVPEVLAQVVERAHGHRRGTFARSVIEVRDYGAERPDTFSLDLPERMRVDRHDGSHLLIRGDQAWKWHDGTAATPLQGAELEAADKLRAWMGMVILLPLQQPALTTSRDDGGTVSWTVGPAGQRYRLEYEPASDRPRMLTGPAGAVLFMHFLDRRKLCVPQAVTLGDGVARQLHFVGTGFRFDEEMFALPAERSDRGSDIVLGGNGDTGPRLVERESLSWLSTPDPGDWAGRMELYSKLGRRLGEAGYVNAGDPLLLNEGADDWFVIQYRPGREDPNPIATGPGERHRFEEIPAHRQLVVQAPPGDWEDRIAKAKAELERHLEDRGMEAAGPIEVTVNLHSCRPDLDPAGLRDTPLSVAVRLAR